MLFEKINDNIIKVNGSKPQLLFIDKIYTIILEGSIIRIYTITGRALDICDCTTDNFNELENILKECKNG